MSHHKKTAMAVGTCTIATGYVITVMTWDETSLATLGRVAILFGGAILCWAALTRTFQEVMRPATDAYELGFQVGYDKGHVEGHAVARPVVVPLPPLVRCLECDDRERDALDAVEALADARVEAALENERRDLRAV